MTKSLHLGRATLAVACVGGAGLSTVPADAQIIYSGTINLTIPVNVDGVYLNVVTGATATGSFTGWDINPYSASSLTWFTPSATTHGVVAGGGSSATLVDNLALGTLVSGSSIFSSNQASESTGATAWNFNSSNNYVGFRFINEAAGNLTTFGWMQVRLGASFIDPARAIIGYAYQSNGGSLLVGDTGAAAVPEPGTYLAGFAAGALALRAWRRRGQRPVPVA